VHNAKQSLAVVCALAVIFLSNTQPIASGSTQEERYKATKIKAYNEIRKAASEGDAGRLSLNYDVSKSFPTDLQRLYTEQARYTSKLVATFLPEKEIVTIYLYTEKDAAKISKHPMLSRDSDSFQPWFKEWERGDSREHNLGLAARYWLDTDGWQGHAGVLVHSGATTKSLRRYAIQVLPHEYFHVVQDFYLNKSRNSNFWDSYDEYAKFSPPTFREGSANTISFALASKNKTEYLSLYRYFIGEKKTQREVKFFREVGNQKAVIKTLTLLENNNNRQDVQEASYAIGQLLYEWVISEYGFEGYRRIVENQFEVSNFSENIRLSLGISIQNLYKRAAPHIVSGFRYGY
jgi:hypothetical protein